MHTHSKDIAPEQTLPPTEDSTVSSKSVMTKPLRSRSDAELELSDGLDAGDMAVEFAMLLWIFANSRLRFAPTWFQMNVPMAATELAKVPRKVVVNGIPSSLKTYP